MAATPSNKRCVMLLAILQIVLELQMLPALLYCSLHLSHYLMVHQHPSSLNYSHPLHHLSFLQYHLMPFAVICPLLMMMMGRR